MFGRLWAADLPPQVQQSESERVALIRRITPSAVSVLAAGTGAGSAVLVTADGFALTNFHVVAQLGDVMYCGLPDGGMCPGVVVGLDPTGDVAMIKLLGRDSFPLAPLGNSDDLKVGEWVMALGNPFNLSVDFQPTVTFGIISGLHRYQYPAGGGYLESPDCIQTDAAINPGNSGGPLFNLRGEVVGVNSRVSFEKRVRVNSGFGYAVSINQIKHFYHALKAGRVVDRATLGATLSSDPEGRPVVTDILPESDAYRRGLRVGDEVTSLDGRPVTTVNEFKNLVGTLPSGWRVPLVAHRGGERLETRVRLMPLRGADWDFFEEQERKKKSQPAPHAPPQPTPEEKPKGPPEFEAARKSVERRPGFANFAFNRIEQDRLLKAFRGFIRTDSKPLPAGTWELKGSIGEVSFTMKIRGETGFLKIGDMEFTTEREDLLAPIGDDGMALLRSFILWRGLLCKAQQGFQSFYYEGRGPSTLGMADVAMALTGPISFRWYFDLESAALREFEVFFDRNSDPYEFLLGEYQEVNGVLMPHLFLVRVGDDIIGKLTVKAYQFSQE